MAQIQTVRGPIDSAQLGTTLMHEHVFVLDKEISENYPENWGLEEKRVADAVSRLNELKSRGVDTISTHTHALRRVGLDQQRIFREEGVDLSRVVIGHSGDTTDLDYLEELISHGSYLGMDRFGIDSILSFEDRVNTVAAMCARGYAERMVLSHDAACYMHHLPERELPALLPRWHYLHIHNDVLPALKQKGVSDEQLHTMLVENPRKIFERQGAY